MTDYKIGDRVRFVQEWKGVIKNIVLAPDPYVEFETGRRIYTGSWVQDGESALSVEVIEPEYESGAMYVDADGDYFCYLPDHDIEMGPWYSPGSDMGYGDSYLPRPLRKLVPEGGK